MRGTDIEAVGELGGEALAAGGGLAQELHEGIAGRPFGILGPVAAPVRAVHDATARAVYGAVRGGLRVAARGAATALAAGAGEDASALEATPTGSLALGAVNGVFGDRLSNRGHPLALEMRVRRHGEDVALSEDGLALAFPDATPRVALFVHGLCGDEDAWRRFPLDGNHTARRAYGERLREELGFTPVMLRYNSGLRVSRNGRDLARLLDDLLINWHVPVEELVLIGHSMGGLVIRSACHYGAQEGRRWIAAVRHVVSLGSPHLGADLEKAVNVASWALRRLPETRALASVLNARSVGIKDLRHGACVDEDWRGCQDPDELLRDRCVDVPFLPHARYCFIGATVADGALGHALGDLLVRLPSASGRGRARRIPFAAEDGHELTGVTHMGLLNHPAVYAQLRAWVARPRAASP